MASKASTLPPLKIVTVNAYLLVLDKRRYLLNSPKPEERLNLLTDWLKKQEADVILIQEASGQEVHDRIKNAVGDNFSIYDEGGRFDLMAFSRYPIIEKSFHQMRWQAHEMYRCGMVSLLGYREGLSNFVIDFHGTEVRIVNTHPMFRDASFEHARDFSDAYTPERLASQLEAWEVLHSQLQEGPVIFAGDFNFNPDDEEFQWFNQLFGLNNSVLEVMKSGLYQGALSTYTPDNSYVHEPDWGILDHIFMNQWVTPIQATIVNTKPDFSDHFPVMATLQVRSNSAPMCSAPSPPPISLAQVRRLIEHFKNIDLNGICDASALLGNEDLHNQISSTLVFLKGIEQEILMDQ